MLDSAPTLVAETTEGERKFPLQVAILGSLGSRVHAPFQEKNPDGSYVWEIWSQRICDLPRYDRWFESHEESVVKGLENKLWDWMTKQPIEKPIYMREVHPEIPASVRFPREEMIEKFGGSIAGTWFFTSTIAWEIAFAIHLGAKKIALFGVEMSDEDEYKEQKPGCRHFLHMAMMLGIEIVIPENSMLIAPVSTYGFINDPLMESRLDGRMAEIKAMLDGARKLRLEQQGIVNEVQQKINVMDRDIRDFQIRIHELEHLKRNWT